MFTFFLQQWHVHIPHLEQLAPASVWGPPGAGAAEGERPPGGSVSWSGSVNDFGPPGSGSVIICTDPDPSITNFKKVRKTLISTVLWLLYDFFLSLKTYKLYLQKSNKPKTYRQKNYFLLALCRMYIFYTYRYIRCVCCSSFAHRFSFVQDVHTGGERCSGSPI